MIKRVGVIGLMSGTSLDGVDLALCSFEERAEGWQYLLLDAHTVPYPDEWKRKLGSAHLLEADALDTLDQEYGHYLATLVKEFIDKTGASPELIASHGHTVFHEPEKGITRQIGSGERLFALTGLPVVYDFRTLDVLKGGQGAPLVPVGDKLLFREYDACLNLGGFSNISFDYRGSRIAFDICPVNLALNYLAEKTGHAFDRDGELGRQGKVDSELLETMNNLPYYSRQHPKSLGREWVDENIIPLLETWGIETKDLAATVYQHITEQILQVLNKYGISSVLITGGGALNTYLVNKLHTETKTKIQVPDRQLIDYKEAVIFAFLGLLRMEERVNCYASVTGAFEDSIVGVLIKNEPRNDPGLNPNKKQSNY
ncbi:MAG: anhydro-N-acetylmuramic acid kinase [Bacteroidales bacterium]|nr:anhydro-N-acetylmuramic acid kinase [Bacteroidales bacterium]